MSDDYGTVAGGRQNRAGDLAGTTADHAYASVGGGFDNVASGLNSTVAGGLNNLAGGSYATVPGGRSSSAESDYSFAAGRRARVNAAQTGAFVWADSSDFNFFALASNEFAVRATGGARIVSGIDGGGGATAGVTLAAGGGSWSAISDRALKRDFVPLDGRDALEKLVSVPIGTWSYIAQDPSVRHAGPAAQDFYAAFGLGEDERHITTIDADGVAFAAIQGLHEVVQEKDARISSLEQRLEALEEGAGSATVAKAASGDIPGGLMLGIAWLVAAASFGAGIVLVLRR